MAYNKKDRKGSHIVFSSRSLITILLTLSLVTVFFSVTPGVSQPYPTDLIVSEGDSMLITAPEFSLKGSIIVMAGGTLRIEETSFNIFQDHDRDYGIVLYEGASLYLSNSTLRSSRSLDLDMRTDSQIFIYDSKLELPGTLGGTPNIVYISNSEVMLDQIHIKAGRIEISNSLVKTDQMSISTDITGSVENSILQTHLTITDGSRVNMYGSAALSLKATQNSVIYVHREVNIYVDDAAGVPTAGAEVAATQFGMHHPTMQGNTGVDGIWTGYLLSEVVRPESSSYSGNYRIKAVYNNHIATSSVSLLPVEEHTSQQLRNIDFGVSVKLRFADILPATGYYQSGVRDLTLTGSDNFKVTTYPNSETTSFIHEGNIFVNQSAIMTVTEGSGFRVVNRVNNYRVEVRDGGTLAITDGANFWGDRPVNIYLHDSSKLLIDGGTLKAGVIVGMDSSSIMIRSGYLEAEQIYLNSESFSVSDSVVDADRLQVNAANVELEYSTFDVDSMDLDSPDIHMDGVEISAPLYLNSTTNELEITDVVTPNIYAGDGLRVHRSWHVSIRVINTRNVLVPATNVSIYRVDGTRLEAVEEKFVATGRTSFTIVGEIIDEHGTVFVGNYLLRANKDVGSNIFESRDTMVAADKNQEATVKFDQHFPYSLVLDVDIPDRQFGRGETIEISGTAFYEGADLDVSEALVQVRINRMNNMVWDTRTNGNGQFSIEIETPNQPGRYSLVVSVTDPNMNMTGERTFTIVVDGEEDSLSLRQFMFESTLGVTITVLLIIILLALAYLVITWPFNKSKPSLSTSSTEEIIMWADSVVKRR